MSYFQSSFGSTRKVQFSMDSDFDDPLADILPDEGPSKPRSIEPTKGRSDDNSEKKFPNTSRSSFVDDGMDLFPTKGSKDPPKSNSSKSDFMAELFGGPSASKAATKDSSNFQLDSAYTKTASSTGSFLSAQFFRDAHLVRG